jgi:DNA-nicking Smr family endonuclease
MTTDKRRRRAGNDTAHDDDHALWQHVARQVTPSAGMKRRVPDVEPPGGEGPGRRLMLKRTTRVLAASAIAGAATAGSPVAHQKKVPPLADFDAKKARRIASGRIDIDARIDLHGMRQDEAHAALVAFLLTAQARGHRIVLVITGKGGPPVRDETHGDPWGRERGVLKRNVPRWLEEQELRRIVVSHTAASQRHGGEGALYLHLRAPGR